MEFANKQEKNYQHTNDTSSYYYFFLLKKKRENRIIRCGKVLT